MGLTPQVSLPTSHLQHYTPLGRILLKIQSQVTTHTTWCNLAPLSAAALRYVYAADGASSASAVSGYIKLIMQLAD